MRVLVSGLNKRVSDRRERDREVSLIEGHEVQTSNFLDVESLKAYQVLNSECIVAEVDTESPDTMFELGMAYATNKIMEDLQRTVKDYYLKNQDNKELRNALYDFAINLKSEVLDSYPEKKILTHISDHTVVSTDGEIELPSHMSNYIKLFGSINKTSEKAIEKI